MKVKILILIGGIILLCQIFRPIEAAINDNLLLNSGWKSSIDKWTILSGTYNTELMETNGVIVSDGTKIKLKYNEPIKFIVGNDLTLSFKTNGSSNGCTLDMTYYFTDGTSIGIAVIIPQLYGTNEYNHKISISPIQDGKVATYAVINYIEILAGQGKYAYKPKLEYGRNQTEYCPSIYDNVEFDYDSLNASFQWAKDGDIKPKTYEYTKNLGDIGSFTMTVERNQTYVKNIKPDYMLCYDGDFLIVEDIDYDYPITTITGSDLKGILKSRITLGTTSNGSMSYYSVVGSTEYCLKKLILDSIINPTDSGDKIPLVTLTENKDRGLPSDSIKSRFEQVDIVAKNLCSNANIGYDMTADLRNNKILADMIDIVDKSAEQSERNRIIFDINKRNVSSYKRSIGNSTSKTFFYGTSSLGNTEQATTYETCYRGNTAPTGWARKTKYISVNVENDTEIQSKLKQQTSDYQEINSIELQPADSNMYGKLYQLGDKVTLKDKDVYTHEVITSVTKRISKTEKTIILGFGHKKPRPLAYLNLQAKEAKI